MNSKNKGSSYERHICKLLSLWVTRGKREDSFWRSAMSGGRATVRGADKVRQGGDICAVSPEGHALTDLVYIECKHYRKLGLESFLLFNRGVLAKFWKTTVSEAKKHGREPLLIARQNMWPDLVLLRPGAVSQLVGTNGTGMVIRVKGLSCEVRFLKDFLAQPFKAGGS